MKTQNLRQTYNWKPIHNCRILNFAYKNLYFVFDKVKAGCPKLGDNVVSINQVCPGLSRWTKSWDLSPPGGQV